MECVLRAGEKGGRLGDRAAPPFLLALGSGIVVMPPVEGTDGWGGFLLANGVHVFGFKGQRTRWTNDGDR